MGKYNKKKSGLNPIKYKYLKGFLSQFVFLKLQMVGIIKGTSFEKIPP